MRKTGSRLGTRVLEELAEDGVGNTSQRVKRPEHTEPHKCLVRRRMRASDNVCGESQARQMAADCREKSSGPEGTNFWYDTCRTGFGATLLLPEKGKDFRLASPKTHVKSDRGKIAVTPVFGQG